VSIANRDTQGAGVHDGNIDHIITNVGRLIGTDHQFV